MTAFAPTPAQGIVIEAPLVNLRVTAGAGSGKTTTIAHRIAALLNRGHGPVLALTFTNRAADELSGRVDEALESHLRHAVDVSTYHGFASEILTEFGAVIGIERGTSILTPASSRRLLDDAMRSVELEVFDPTLRGSLGKLRKLSSALADNLLEPKDLLSGASIDDAVAAARAEMLQVLSEYERTKRNLGVIDYGDLIRSSYRLCTEYPKIAERIAGRYRVVLCDEYQDTNPAQRELLRSIFADRVPVNVVGDPFQTIYEWRGASVENFRDFDRHFGYTLNLSLSENRRSGQRILDVANLIRNRIGEHSPLVPVEKAPPSRVGIGWFEDSMAEANWIAAEMLRLGQDHEWSEMAVLLRKNRDVAWVRDALTAHGIPSEVVSVGGLLEVPEIAELVAWLRIFADPTDDLALVRVLTGGRYRCGLGDIARLRSIARRSGSHREIPFTLLEAAVQDPRFGDFVRDYHRLLASGEVTVAGITDAVIELTGAWAEIEGMIEDGLSTRLNFHRFLELAGQSTRDGDDLNAFLQLLEDMTAENDGLDTATVSGSNAVSLLTIHKAKGLEWPIVFIPAAYRGNFPGKGAADDPQRLPESLPVEARIATGSLSDEHTEEWRVAYVAVTRAQRALYVTGAHWYGTPQPRKLPVQPGAVYELLATSGLAECISSAEVPLRPKVLGIAGDAEPPPDPLFDRSWVMALRDEINQPGAATAHAHSMGIEAAYDESVSELQGLLFELPEPNPRRTAIELSATGLVTYARCPKRYFWTYVDPIPVRPAPSALRGSRVHRMIELHNLGLWGFGESPDELFSVFLESRFADRRPAAVEMPFEIGPISDVRIRGRIDAIYDHEDRTEVVDFKTGRASRDPARLVQLQVYALAMGDLRKKLEVTFAFLGSGDTETHRVDPAWMDDARTTVSALAGRIREAHWEPRPGSQCEHCPFLRFCRPRRM